MNNKRLDLIGAFIFYSFFAALLIFVLMYGDMKG